MLRMMLLGLLIPLGVGVLAAMELRTPVRSAAVVVQPVAETTEDLSDSHVALAKADRLEVAAASSETPVQPAPVDEGVPPSEDISVGPSEPPRVINRHPHNPKSKKATTAVRPKKVAIAARPKPQPKPTAIARTTTTSERRKVASDTESCRLSAFGGLRKALNSLDCEI
jgi:hypothetical protein